MGWPSPSTVRLDGTVALVAVAVAAVALAVQVYSIAYLGPGSDDDPDADRRYLPYAAQISLFTARDAAGGGLR